MPKPDPLAAELDELSTGETTSQGKVERWFGDRPDVLDAIRRARARGVPYAAIAKKLSTPDRYLSDKAVKSWLDRQG